MAELVETLAYCAVTVGAVALMSWAMDREERRKTPEERKAEEQWYWRHGR